MAEITLTSLRSVEGSWNSTRNTRNFSYPEYGTISPGLARRLIAYAERELSAAGFGPALAGCAIEVLTCDADLPASERDYQVTFTTPVGGSLSVDGILTSHGWPILDHGFTASRR